MGEEIKKILPVSVAGVIHNNKILLIKRVKQPYKDHWSLLAGKVEFGEHPQEAALREVKEETDLDCEFEEFKGIASEVLHNNNEKVFHSIMYVCKLKPLHTNIVESKEGELRWFGFNELDNIKIIPSDKEMIRRFILKDNKFNLHKIKMTQEGESYILDEFKE